METIALLAAVVVALAWSLKVGGVGARAIPAARSVQVGTPTFPRSIPLKRRLHADAPRRRFRPFSNRSKPVSRTETRAQRVAAELRRI